MKKINESTIVEIFIIWFLFQTVITSSLLIYSDYKNIVSVILKINITARILMILFGICVLLYNKVKKNFIIPLFIYALIVIITKLYNDSYEFLDALFIAFVFRDKLKQENIINIFLGTILISLSIVIVLYFAGVFPSYDLIRSDGKVRISLGFAHPNTLGYYIMILCFLGVLRIKGKVKCYHILLLAAASYFVYVYPNSKTSAFSILLFAFYLVINKIYSFIHNKNITKNRIFRIGSIILIPILIIAVYRVVYIALDYTMSNEAFRAFFNRFRLGNSAFQQYGIHLFGSKEIEFAGTAARYFGITTAKYFTVDSFYIYILVKFGIIPSLFFFIYYISCIKACINAGDSYILVMLLIIAVYSISESMILAIPSSFLFIISSKYLWNRENNLASKLNRTANLIIFTKLENKDI